MSSKTSSRIRRPTVAATTIGAGALLTVTGCTTPISSIDASLIGAVLTPYGADSLSVDLTGGTLNVRAPAENQAGAIRLAVLPVDAPQVSDEEACGSWLPGTGHPFRQEGVALRMATVGGVTRGITVTKNVWLNGFWLFNVHVWDTSVPTSDTTSPATEIASFDLGSSFGTGAGLRPLPWRMCAQALGDTVTFKVWPLTTAEPAWGDPAYGGTVRLPTPVPPGRPGWYSGHLQPGSTMVYADRTVTDLTAVATFDARRARRAAPLPAPRTPTHAPTLP